MKKKLLGFVLCLGIVSLFGFSNITYKSSNIVYTENNINLIGEQVSVRGIDEGAFHVLSRDGEKVRLFADFSVKRGYGYNFSGDGDTPVAFENSMLYQGVQDGTKTWKSDIESNGGRTNIYLADAPTLDEILAVGNFVKNEYQGGLREYESTDLTPEWIIQYGTNDSGGYLTKTTNGNGVYYVSFSKNYNALICLSRSATRYDQYGQAIYGDDVRPTLETSIYNLSSDNEEIQSYLNSVRAEMDAKENQSNDNVSNEDKAQVVKVPSTGIDAPIVFTVVGLAVIVITGIIIWVIVKGRKK